MQIFINILVFIAALLIVICWHEFGHFLVAKACNVYCFEFSIGFGPAIFKHKFKHKRKMAKPKEGEKPLFEALTQGLDKVEGETQFSIRCLPLGGYVAMAGEDGEDDGDVKVPKERTLTGVNHFKQICIMLAGITMNFILCFLLFFISFSFCPQIEYLNSSNQVTVVADSAIYDAGVRTGDSITYMYQVYENLGIKDDTNGETVNLEFPASEDREKLTGYMVFQDPNQTSGTFDELSHASIAYAAQDMLIVPAFNGNPFDNLVATSESTRTIHFTYVDSDGSSHQVDDLVLETTQNEDGSYTFESIGISQMTDTFTYGAKDGVVIAGRQFGSLFVGIYHALGNLFTPDGWQNIGGLISVYEMSAQGVESGSIGYVLYLWGYISLNLGCFNLLPIPGLDGWQTLVALGETVSRRKASSKFKAIANTIGLILLLALGVGLIIKDIIML